MNKEAIYHKSKSNYSYNYDGKSVHIILRTKKQDIDEVNLVYGDSSHFKNKRWIFDKIPMKLVGSGQLFDYWKIRILPEYRRLRYCFEVKDKKEKYYYTEKGFYDELPVHDVNYHFCFPYVHESELFSPPEWVKDTVWYQIFPERFANGDESLNPVEAVPWRSEPPVYNNFFGGDFQGVINHLDYLEELGITGIYFTPIFKAASNHKYDTVDYMEIDPQFGSKETFRQLIKQCHDRGIRIILDAVFNHSGYDFPPFKDVLENGKSSSYKNWFYIREFPEANDSMFKYETFGFEPTMPKLNTVDPNVRKYLLEVAEYWTKEFDIDGWRLDVASEVDHVFWQKFRKVVKSINPDAYILGEVWHDALPWLMGDQFDATMNYPYTYAVIDFFAKQQMSLKEFKEKITDTVFMYPSNVNEVQFNLLDSHDTARILTLAGNNKKKAKLMYFFHLSFVGAPCIYYGSEIGMAGGEDPGNRGCMIWDKDQQDLEMFTFFKRLVFLRKEKEAFGHKGSFSFLEEYTDDNIMVYERKTRNQKIICIINNSNKSVTVKLEELKNKVTNDLMDQQTKLFNQDGQLSVDSYGYFALEIEGDNK